MKQVSTFAERLKEAIGDRSYSDIGSSIGLSKQAIGAYITQARVPKRPTIAALAKALGVNEAWLCGLDAPKRVDITDTIPVTSTKMIPVVGCVYAGANGIAQTDRQGYEPAYNLTSSGDYSYFIVKGDSMTPDIRPGDLALVREQSDVESGDLAVVIVNGEEGLIKKVQKQRESVVLVSSNPDYPPRVFVGKEANDVKIWGRVMEVKRKY